MHTYKSDGLVSKMLTVAIFGTGTSGDFYYLCTREIFFKNFFLYLTEGVREGT